MEELILDYKEVQQIARETIEYAKTFIKTELYSFCFLL